MDITYFESGFIDDAYFVYTADGSAQLTAYASEVVVGGYKRTDSAQLSSAFTMNAKATIVLRISITPTAYTTSNYSQFGSFYIDAGPTV